MAKSNTPCAILFMTTNEHRQHYDLSRPRLGRESVDIISSYRVVTGISKEFIGLRLLWGGLHCISRAFNAVAFHGNSINISEAVFGQLLACSGIAHIPEYEIIECNI